MHAACLSGCGRGARWGRGGVTAAKGWVVQLGCAAGEGHGGAAGSFRGQMGSSVLLCVQLSLAAAHGCDERGPLTAAVLREQEVDVTFWGELLHRLLEDPREAEGGEQQESAVRGGSSLLNSQE